MALGQLTLLYFPWVSGGRSTDNVITAERLAAASLRKRIRAAHISAEQRARLEIFRST